MVNTAGSGAPFSPVSEATGSVAKTSSTRPSITSPTVMCTGGEVTIAPGDLSKDAVKTWAPGVGFVQKKVWALGRQGMVGRPKWGGFDWPIKVSPAKNLT